MTDQSCNNCQFFTAVPCSDRYMVDLAGFYGNCRKQAPYHNGWPTTWGTYWCGDWQERKRPPVVNPGPSWAFEANEEQK